MLGISHPPGHPLYNILAKGISFIPVGSISFRINLLSALCQVIFVFFLFKCFFRLIPQAGINLKTLLGGGLIFSFVISKGVFFESLRAEVYTLNAAISLLFLFLFTSFLMKKDWAYFFSSLFLIGFGLGNHHLLLLVILFGAFISLFWRIKKSAFRLRLIVFSLIFIFWGSLIYLYLSLRGDTLISIGSGASFREFLETVLASQFQPSLIASKSIPFIERLSSVVYFIMEPLHPIIVVLSLGGIWVLWRTQRSEVAFLWTYVPLSMLVLRAQMGFDPQNPDVYGYMLVPLGAISLLATLFIGEVLHIFYKQRHIFWKIGVYLLGGVILLLPFKKLVKVLRGQEFSKFYVVQDFQEEIFSNIPPKGMIITSYFKTIFGLWYARAVEGFRPDVKIFPYAFLGYPGFRRKVERYYPELAGLIQRSKEAKKLHLRSLFELQRQYEIFFELDFFIPSEILDFLSPQGIMYKLNSKRVSLKELDILAFSQHELWKKIIERFSDWTNESETERSIFWFRYLDSVFFARRGARLAALRSLEFCERINPLSPEIKRLKRALKKAKIPLDIRSFIPK
jgi:hypothetical protein